MPSGEISPPWRSGKRLLPAPKWRRHADKRHRDVVFVLLCHSSCSRTLPTNHAAVLFSQFGCSFSLQPHCGFAFSVVAPPLDGLRPGKVPGAQQRREAGPHAKRSGTSKRSPCHGCDTSLGFGREFVPPPNPCGVSGPRFCSLITVESYRNLIYQGTFGEENLKMMV